jgi:hypothetical protein
MTVFFYPDTAGFPQIPMVKTLGAPGPFILPLTAPTQPALRSQRMGGDAFPP